MKHSRRIKSIPNVYRTCRSFGVPRAEAVFRVVAYVLAGRTGYYRIRPLR